jgi:hypothetical protein
MLYLLSFKRFILISLALLGLSISSANASTIIGGDLLDQAGANQLESWLGVGNQTFTNIFDGTYSVCKPRAAATSPYMDWRRTRSHPTRAQYPSQRQSVYSAQP